MHTHHRRTQVGLTIKDIITLLGGLPEGVWTGANLRKAPNNKPHTNYTKKRCAEKLHSVLFVERVARIKLTSPFRKKGILTLN